MYCGGGKGRCARRACGVGEAAGCACPNAAVAARLDNASARKHFFAARVNSKRACMAVSRIYFAFDEKRSRDSGTTLTQRQARRIDSAIGWDGRAITWSGRQGARVPRRSNRRVLLRRRGKALNRDEAACMYSEA